MSKELIEKLREDGKFLGGNFGKLMHEAADALESKAAPVGEREVVSRAICSACEEGPDHPGCEPGNKYRWQDYLSVADAAISAYQRAQQPSEYGDAYQGAREDLAIWKRRALEAEEKLRVYDSRIVGLGVLAMQSATTQPSAGVVMPNRRESRKGDAQKWVDWRDGFNACLDEFARLNGKEVGRG